MSERLPPKYFDKLTDSIWELGRVGMRHLLEIAPTPGTVKGEIYHEDLCFEPEFLLKRPYPELLDETPSRMELVISEMEPYSRDENFTIYAFRRLSLTVTQRTKHYDRGIILMDANGNTMTPRLDLQPSGRKRPPGIAPWRDLTDKANHLNKTEADYMLENVEKLTDKIYQENLGG